jgi:ankyrin repeat protein
MQAARAGDHPTAKLLVQYDAQLELRDRAGNTALHYAILFNHQAVGVVLVRAGAKHDAFQAAALGLKTEVERFLRDDPSLLNTRDMQGYNLLQWAVLRNHSDLVQLVLMHKPELNPFELAALGRTGELEMLLAKDPELAKRADPYTRLTALQWAVLGKSHAAAELLLRKGADPNVDSQPPVPTSPLVLAIRQGDIDMVRLLLRYGADHKRFYPGLGTPYTMAVAQKRRDIAALLK